jgi:hypothetical protein
MSAVEAPHTVLVHVNVEVPHGAWQDLLEGMYDQYVSAEAEEPTGMPLMTWDEWCEGEGRNVAANALADEITGAIEVGTDEDHTPILCAVGEICIPLAEEV